MVLRPVTSLLLGTLFSLEGFTQILPPPPPPPPGGGSGVGPGQFTSFVTGPIIASAPDEKTGERTFLINTPVGVLPVVIKPLGDDLSFDAPNAPEPPAFRPPSIFSAPMPTGSGARSLGFAGAFSSIADDATAASWNPAGLLNLERPEASGTFRFSTVKNTHRSSDPNFEVDEDKYDSEGLNYFSIAYPFYWTRMKRNAVVSFNYQEAYEFEQAFSANIKDSSREVVSQSNSKIFSETQTDSFAFEDGKLTLDLITEFTTRSSSTLNQVLETETDAKLEFQQQGIIDAISPAAAVEITPKLFFGVAANFYQDGSYQSKKIRSRAVTRFTSVSKSTATVINEQTTSGNWRYDGNIATDGIPPFVPPGNLPIPEISGEFEPFTDRSVETSVSTLIVDGTVEEKDSFDSLQGFNTTWGLLYTVNRFITLAASADLPWTARADQTKTVSIENITYNADRSAELSRTESVTEERKNVKFNFPLFWTLGSTVRWTPNFYSSIDVSRTHWSDFSFESAGEGKINPFDGSPYGESPIKDTWAVKLGTEYLFVTRKNEIPLRGGLLWEQRPAIGDPDNYFGFSIGSGVSIGRDPGKLIVDFAFSYMRAEDVQTVVAGQEGLKTDTEQMQFYISLINHF